LIIVHPWFLRRPIVSRHERHRQLAGQFELLVGSLVTHAPHERVVSRAPSIAIRGD